MTNEHLLLSDRFINLKIKRKYKIGYLSGSIYEKIKNQLSSEYETIPFTRTIRAVDQLKKHKLDMVLGDYFTSWTYNLKVVSKVKNLKKDQLGILFRKNSKLYKNLNPILKTFIKSEKYVQLVKQYFGKEAANYLLNNR